MVLSEFKPEPYRESLKIVCISDVHLLSINCDESAFIKTLAYINQTPDCYCLINGDLWDCIHKRDLKRFNVNSIAKKYINKIDSLLDYAVLRAEELLSHTASLKKIIGIGLGNHETSSWHECATNPTYNLCRRLQVPYLGYQYFIRCGIANNTRKSARRTFTIFGNHGTGAGKKPGSSINNLYDLISAWDADIYIMGHDHKSITADIKRLGVTKKGKLDFVSDSKLLVRTGTYLKTVEKEIYDINKFDIPNLPHYAETKCYPPTAIGSQLIEAKINRKQTKDSNVIDLSIKCLGMV